MLMDEIQSIDGTKKELRQFGLTVGIALGVLSLIFWWRGKEFYPYVAVLGISLLTGGIFLPTLLKPFYKAWMAFAVVMSWFMTRVILSILFYVVITPISAMARVSGKKFLDLKMDKTRETYWMNQAVENVDVTDCERQF